MFTLVRGINLSLHLFDSIKGLRCSTPRNWDTYGKLLENSVYKESTYSDSSPASLLSAWHVCPLVIIPRRSAALCAISPFLSDPETLRGKRVVTSHRSLYAWHHPKKSLHSHSLFCCKLHCGGKGCQETSLMICLTKQSVGLGERQCRLNRASISTPPWIGTLEAQDFLLFYQHDSGVQRIWRTYPTLVASQVGSSVNTVLCMLWHMFSRDYLSLCHTC